MTDDALAEEAIGVLLKAGDIDRAVYWLSLAEEAHVARGTLPEFWNDLDRLRRHYSKHPGLIRRLERFSTGWDGAEGGRLGE